MEKQLLTAAKIRSSVLNEILMDYHVEMSTKTLEIHVWSLREMSQLKM